MKLAVVGGGSTYTPELVDGMARLRDALPLEQVVLVDPDLVAHEPCERDAHVEVGLLELL